MSDKMFIPRRNFVPDYPEVCGNCVYWVDDLMSWGHVSICKLDWKPVQPGDLCRIECGEKKKK